MNNNLFYQKSFWKRNKIWLILITLFISLLFLFVFKISKNKNFSDVIIAYADSELYEKALKTAKKDSKVIEILGQIKPIEKSAILEGTVSYSLKYDTINSSVRIVGSKARGRLDIFAVKVNNDWKFNVLKIRIKRPIDKKQTIEILNLD